MSLARPIKSPNLLAIPSVPLCLLAPSEVAFPMVYALSLTVRRHRRLSPPIGERTNRILELSDKRWLFGLVNAYSSSKFPYLSWLGWIRSFILVWFRFFGNLGEPNQLPGLTLNTSCYEAPLRIGKRDTQNIRGPWLVYYFVYKRASPGDPRYSIRKEVQILTFPRFQ